MIILRERKVISILRERRDMSILIKSGAWLY